MQSPVYADNSTVTGDGTSVHPLTAGGGGATPGGADTAIQFNNAGAFGGNAPAFAFENATQQFLVDLTGPTAAIELSSVGSGASVLLQGGDTGLMVLDMQFTADGQLTLGNSEDNAGVSILNGATTGFSAGITIHENSASGHQATFAISLIADIGTIALEANDGSISIQGTNGISLNSSAAMTVQATDGITVQSTVTDVTLTSNRNVRVQANPGGGLGFYDTPPVTQQTITGAKLPSDVVMASLLTALANLGLIIDSTT